MISSDVKLNGVTFNADDPHSYLDQTHGVLAALEAAISDTAEAGPLNSLLLASAVRGAETLLYLAAIGLHRMDSRLAAAIDRAA